MATTKNTMPEQYDAAEAGVETPATQEEVLMDENALLRGLIEAWNE